MGSSLPRLSRCDQTPWPRCIVMSTLWRIAGCEAGDRMSSCPIFGRIGASSTRRQASAIGPPPRRCGPLRLFAATLAAWCLILLDETPSGAVSSAAKTGSMHQLDQQATRALQPLVIIAAVVLLVSFFSRELARPRRKSRKRGVRTARQRSTGRFPRSKARPVVTSHLTAASPMPRAAALSSQADQAGMYGRTAGASAERRADELARERVAWAAGGAGERQVGSELARLPSGQWWVFHDLPRGDSGTNLDHLVIGVGGVYTINTKNLSGNVWVAERVLMVNGVRTSYLPAAVYEARDTQRRLSRAGRPVDVAPLLVFTRPITVKALPPDVGVLSIDMVRPWFERLPRVLTPEQAYEIVLIADRPDTWA